MTKTAPTVTINRDLYKGLLAFVRDVRRAIRTDKTIVNRTDADDAAWFVEEASKLLKKAAAPMTHPEVVKVQRPLATNDVPGNPPWYIYDAKRVHRQLIPEHHVPRSVRDAMGGDMKAYFIATWAHDRWKLGGRTSEQIW